MRYLQNNPAVSISKLAAWLGRSEAAVKYKRHELGIGKERRWSEADTEFLRKNPRMPVKEVARRLGKQKNSIHNKRKALGIRSHEWTEEEDKAVRMWHNRLSAEKIAARLPGRTTMAVAIRARQMGLHSNIFWKDSDVEFLKANPGMSVAEAARILNKTVNGVYHKRRSLGMTRKLARKKWTDGDKALLAELTRGRTTAKTIAARLGRTKASVQAMQKIMGLRVPRSEKALKPDDERFLRKNPDMPAVEIADHIGRSPELVRTWRRKLGLPRYQEHKRWTRSEIELLKANLQLPLAEIYALLPCRSPASINAKVDALGRKRLRRKGHTYRNGYKYILRQGGGKIEEHRLVAEQKIGRPLRQNEVVHHINYIRHDNNPENLDVLESGSVHASMPRSVNGLAKGLLEGGAIGYDRDEHSYFLPSGLFERDGPPGTPARYGRFPKQSYVFCGSMTFPFSLQPDRGLADTLGALPHADCMLPLEGRHAVVLYGAAASPARLEDALGASASPFPVVRGRLADHDVVPAGSPAGASSLVQDALAASLGTSAVVWAALLDARQLGAMDACAGRGSLCDLVEVLAPVVFENGEELTVAHSYVLRGGPAPVYGSQAVQGSPPQLSRVFQQFVRSRAKRRAG